MHGRNFCSQKGCKRHAFTRADTAGRRPVFGCAEHAQELVYSLSRHNGNVRIRIEQSDDGFVFGAAPRGGKVSHVAGETQGA